MTHIVESGTLTTLFHDLAQEIIFAYGADLDYQSSIDCHMYDVVGTADSMQWSYNLKTQWLTKGRWGTLVRQYLDPEEVQAWLNLCSELTPEKDRGVATMRTKTVAKRMHGKKPSRRFGSCMLALSYRAIPVPTITLHSRASYLGYLGPLDLTVAYVAARYVGALHDVAVEDFAFRWYVEALQWPNYKSLGYMLRYGDSLLKETLLYPELSQDHEVLVSRYPTIRHARHWMQRYLRQDLNGLSYSEAEKYGAVRRIRQRYHAEHCHPDYGARFADDTCKALKPLPSVQLASLDFSPIGLLS